MTNLLSMRVHATWLTLAMLSACGGGSSSSSSSTAPVGSDSPASVSTPPVTEPPATTPPASIPPVTTPPVTTPPVTSPPVTTPPVTPPVTKPPVTTPPVVTPPVTTPPVATPPVTTPPATTMASLSFAAATYTATDTSVKISVKRTTSSVGTTSVNYSTSNGTGAAGADYTAASGSLTWSDGDTAAKTITIAVNATAASNAKNFKVALTTVTGHAAVGSPAVATVTVQAATPSSTMAIKVKGTQFVDQNGKVFQLRGVNVSGLESVAMFGYSPSDPWGGEKPVWSALQAWKVNAVRFPLNEASWLGYSCVDSNGTTLNPDPGGNYRATVTQTVKDAVAAGLYVILDLHWSAPGTICPTDQNWMADTDHSIAFWTSVANTFKANPAVIFELYNEPVLSDTASGWNIWLNGGAQTTVRPGGGKSYAWTAAGMQSLLDAVRATGATNVVLCGGVSYSNVLNGIASHVPSDPLNQLGVAWHVYSFNIYTDPSPGSSTAKMITAATVNLPLIITEVGDQVGAGKTGAFVAKIANYADTNGYSYFGWTWNDWAQSENVLITNANGTPTTGFGTYFKQHLICRATSASCP